MQIVITHSIIETQYWRLVDTTYDLIWLKLYHDMEIVHSSITPLLCDNWGAIEIAYSDVFLERPKHI